MLNKLDLWNFSHNRYSSLLHSRKRFFEPFKHQFRDKKVAILNYGTIKRFSAVWNVSLTLLFYSSTQISALERCYKNYHNTTIPKIKHCRAFGSRAKLLPWPRQREKKLEACPKRISLARSLFKVSRRCVWLRRRRTCHTQHYSVASHRTRMLNWF